MKAELPESQLTRLQGQVARLEDRVRVLEVMSGTCGLAPHSIVDHDPRGKVAQQNAGTESRALVDEVADEKSATESKDFVNGVSGAGAARESEDSAGGKSDESPATVFTNSEDKASEECSSGGAKGSRTGGEKETTSKESLETRIGLYWLSKLGTGFLVVGVAFLVMYSFQYFGAWHKLATGFLVSTFLVVFGEWLEKKKQAGWVSQVLAGGGWSLAFFTTFAMHHIPSLRVVESPLVSLLLMLTVSGLTIGHSLLRNSEMMAMLALGLGFFTVALTPVGPFAAIASLLLSVTMGVLVVKRGWLKLNIVGLVAGYFSYICLASEHQVVDQQSFGLASLFLAGYWLVQQLVAIALSRSREVEPRLVVAAQALNTILFSALWLPAFGNVYPELADGALLVLAVLYGCSAYLLKDSVLHPVATLSSLTALGLFSAYLPSSLSNNWALAGWAMELPIIAYVGLTQRLKSFRWFAVGLSVCLFFSEIAQLGSQSTVQLGSFVLLWGLVTSFLVIASFLITSNLYRHYADQGLCSVSEQKGAYYGYLTAGSFMAFLTPFVVFPPIFSHAIWSGREFETETWLVIWTTFVLWLVHRGLSDRDWYPTILSLAWIMALLEFCLTVSSSRPESCLLVMAGLVGLSFVVNRQSGESMSRVVRTVAYLAGILGAYSVLGMNFQGDPSVVPVLGVGLFLASLELGMQWKAPAIRLCSVFFLFISCMPALLWHSDWIPAAVCTLGLLGASAIYRNAASEISGESGPFEQFLRIGAVIFWTLFMAANLHLHWLSCGYALEGIVLLAAGFFLSDKPLRIMALTVFAILVGKLLFVDLASADTIYRIIAFILAGVILIGASFGYAAFIEQLKRRGLPDDDGCPAA